MEWRLLAQPHNLRRPLSRPRLHRMEAARDKGMSELSGQARRRTPGGRSSSKQRRRCSVGLMVDPRSQGRWCLTCSVLERQWLCHPAFGLDGIVEGIGRSVDVSGRSGFGRGDEQLSGSCPVWPRENAEGQILAEGVVRVQKGLHPAHGTATRRDEICERQRPVHVVFPLQQRSTTLQYPCVEFSPLSFCNAAGYDRPGAQAHDHMARFHPDPPSLAS